MLLVLYPKDNHSHGLAVQNEKNIATQGWNRLRGLITQKKIQPKNATCTSIVVVARVVSTAAV